MPTHAASTFEVRLDDPLTYTRTCEEMLTEPGRGEIVFEVDRFGLTSNNLTYALLGNQTPTRYWDVFPADTGWGRVPAWGSARVIDGDDSVARKGEQFIGLLPMANRFVFQGHRTDHNVLTSSAPRRNEMPSTYSSMRRVTTEEAEAGATATASILLQPFYLFAALLADYVAGGGAKTAIISSASSKAGLLVGRLLLQRGIRTVGLTAPSRCAATESTGAFTETRSYDNVQDFVADDATFFLDIAGIAKVSEAVIHSMADHLERIIIIGATHYDAPGGTSEFTTSCAPEIHMFDTAEHAVKYGEDHGMAALQVLEDDARADLLPWASAWIGIKEVTGIVNVNEAWTKLQRPSASPLQGTVVTVRQR